MVVAGSSGLKRLFLAVSLGQEARAILNHHLPRLPGKVVPPENWHLTTRFLGRVDQITAEKLTGWLDQIDLGRPFQVALGEMGAFPRPARATVLWLGIERGFQQLSWLNGICEEAAQTAGLAAEDRPYSAHLTLSRIRPQEDVRLLIDGYRPIRLAWTVRELALYESVTGRGGPIYTPIETFPFRPLNGSG